MPLVSIPAVYDGRAVILLETAPSSEPYRVLVTFVEPADAAAIRASARERFLASYGAWEDTRPVEATLEDIREGRSSRLEPPAL
jgi:hypothetical protein